MAISDAERIAHGLVFGVVERQSEGGKVEDLAKAFVEGLEEAGYRQATRDAAPKFADDPQTVQGLLQFLGLSFQAFGAQPEEFGLIPTQFVLSLSQKFDDRGSGELSVRVREPSGPPPKRPRERRR